MDLITVAKFLFTASVIVFSSWLSQKRPDLAGFVMMSMISSTRTLASGDAGGQERLMKRALRRSSMLFSVIVLRFLVYPGRLCVRWLYLDVIIINDNHYD